MNLTFSLKLMNFLVVVLLKMLGANELILMGIYLAPYIRGSLDLPSILK